MFKRLVSFLLFHFLVKAIGVSNQRETTVVWDKLTGEPLYNAVGKPSCRGAAQGLVPFTKVVTGSHLTRKTYVHVSHNLRRWAAEFS